MATTSRAINAAHTAGIFADMTLDGPEIGTLVGVIDRAKNLPNRRTMGKQDPYCAMRLGKEAKKTNTDRRGGQTPRWDQELRFTVHDSPDYYKLKCSVFNDDKKTDLIGEAWIDLQEVIVPGGGQNDIWHQLNFKGKYAGDIRIELTYYDTRPKPEGTPDKRKMRDKAYSETGDPRGAAPSPRQLGPREIQRRPLPPSPGGQSSPVPITNTPDRWPAEGPQPDQWPPQAYTRTPPAPRPRMPETPDDVGLELSSPHDLSPHWHTPYESPRHSGEVYDDHSHYQGLLPDGSSPQIPLTDAYQPRPLPPSPGSRPHSVTASPRTSMDQPPSSHSPRNVPSQTPYHSSPSHTPPQASPSGGPQVQQWPQGRTSTSPTKHAVYRDSPLRQSISQQDMPQPAPPAPDMRFDEDAAPPPPPPPPAHRSQAARPSMTHSSNQSPHVHPAPRTPVKHSSVERRSPLSRLEHGYEDISRSSPFAQDIPSPPQPVPGRPHGPLDAFEHHYLTDHERRRSYNDSMTPPRSIHSAHSTPPSSRPLDYSMSRPFDPAMTRQPYGESPTTDFRRSNGFGPPRRAQTFDSFESPTDMHISRSEPVVVRPRAVSPNPGHTIPRKSITPSPSTPDDRHGINGDPFSPDSYDALNSGTSPIGDCMYGTTDQLQEAARHCEAEQVRDQGPIIGNDGRIIDPSDHLPADTWAPEPERKIRQPEHVVRIRTREDARHQNHSPSSPMSTRPHSIATTPLHTSTLPPSSSQYSESPARPVLPPSPKAESPAGRNRLKKAIPTRPLPAQPYPAPHTSPTVMTTSNEHRQTPGSQPYSMHSSPVSGGPQRAPLANYPGSANGNHSPRGFPRPYPTTPTKSPLHPPGWSMAQGGYDMDDPLARELSMIDIGPPRTGRTAVRPMRGHGGY